MALFFWCDDPFWIKRVEVGPVSSQTELRCWGGAPARRPERRRGGGGGNLLPFQGCLARPTKGSADFYAPRLPADPLARSECIRSFVCSLRALQAPCLGTTLGGTPPQEPHPQGSPPPQGPHHPPPHPTRPPIPTHPPLVRVEGYSEWMAIPSGWLFRWLFRGFLPCWGWGLQRRIPQLGWLFRVHGYWPRGVLLQLKIRIQQTRTRSDSVNAESIDCFRWVIVPSVQSQCSATCKDHQEHPGAPQEYQEHPRSTHEHPGAPQELNGTQEHFGSARAPRSNGPKAPRSTQEHPGALEPV